MQNKTGTLISFPVALLLGAALSSGCGADVSDGPEADTSNPARQTTRQNPATIAAKYLGDACPDGPTGFVVSVLETAGYIDPAHITQAQRINVCSFEGWLNEPQNGWEKITRSQAQVGDVWIDCNPGVIESVAIVSEKGGGETIGCFGTPDYVKEELMTAPGAAYFHKYTDWP